MPNSPTPLFVTVQFGNLETFCEELAARGPNVEPVVRICQQVRQGQSDTHGPLPIEHVFGHVSYLRRTADVLQVIVLHLDLGQRWAYADATEDRAYGRRIPPPTTAAHDNRWGSHSASPSARGVRTQLLGNLVPARAPFAQKIGLLQAGLAQHGEECRSQLLGIGVAPPHHSSRQSR